jgi:hypothetical protein
MTQMAQIPPLERTGAGRIAAGLREGEADHEPPPITDIGRLTPTGLALPQARLRRAAGLAVRLDALQ